MDISSYVNQLLFAHDCVIIPGFGGLVCNYKPADIHPVSNIISPPAKAVSFNKNLKTNDGLLLNFISQQTQLTLVESIGVVNQWVQSSQLQLKRGERVWLKKVGVFSLDVEANMQFLPDESQNYLKSSFGLKSIIAEPLLRGKQISFTEKFEAETKHHTPKKRSLKWAAILLLIVSMGGLVQLMYQGVGVKSLYLDEASVFAFMNNIFTSPEITTQPIEIVSSTPEVVSEISGLEQPTLNAEAELPTATLNNEPNNMAAVNETPASYGSGYYVITGAFVEPGNVETARQHVQATYPQLGVFVERGRRLTKVGFYVGNNYDMAVAKLREAQAEDGSYWLLHR